MTAAGTRKTRKRLATGAAALLLFVSANLLAWALTQPPSPLAAADRLFESLAQRFFSPPLPLRDDVVIVGITEETLARFPYRSPVDRGFLAGLVGKLAASGPRIIGLDILLDSPTEADKDAALRRAIDTAPVPVVAASAGGATRLPPGQRKYLREFLQDRRHGQANLARDRLDDTIRLYLPRDGTGEPAFAAAMAAAAGIPVPDRPFRLAWRRAAGGGQSFPVYPAHLLSYLPPAWIGGKFVLIGSLVPGEDEHRTVGDTLSRPRHGVEIHAQALTQILDRDDTGGAGPPGLLVSGAVSGLGMALAAFGGNLPLLAGLSGLLAAIWAGSVAVLASGGPLLMPMAPSLVLFLGSGGVRLWRGWRERRERRVLMQLFSRFVGESVVRDLWKQREVFLSGGRPRTRELEATVLLSDIAGFTGICEKLPPEPLIAWLDLYIDSMVRIAIAHDGTVLRFIGDGILAVFGAPLPRGDEEEIAADARNAVRCALRMEAAMRTLNAEWRARGLPEAGLRIGIHTGPLVAGSLGSGAHMEYCLLGDVPNTAARLEALGKQYAQGTTDCVILIGDATRKRLEDGVATEPVGEVTLRGKSRPVSVYRVIAGP